MRQAAAEPEPPAAVFHRWVEALERLNRLSEAAAALAEGQVALSRIIPAWSLLAARLARRSGASSRPSIWRGSHRHAGGVAGHPMPGWI